MIMTDNVAILEGYTEEVYGEFEGMDLHFLVKKGTDLDQRFKVWDMDTQKFTQVNGWLANLNYC